MKILYSWLLDFLEEKPGAVEIEKNLLKLGFQVEGVEKTGPSFEGVVTAEILKVEKHPNADKLSVCLLKAGDKNYSVVCGAKNVREGAKVPLARVGAKLKGGKLKKAKIRGVESEGMICSAEELGLEGFDNSGILILPKNTKSGVDARTLFGKEDYLFDIEMLANQGYCLSHMALARELSRFCGYGFRAPEIAPLKAGGDDIASVETDMCLRYSAVTMKNVDGIETPEWMKERLRAMGVNPKDNMLIDVSNYVMFEMGQPTHCFDLSRLKGRKVVIREARDGETILTLDEDELDLNGNSMIIADSEKPVALAGIIGGKESAVSGGTSEILIESACFDPVSVRKTSQEFSVRTDSSYRFERGTDPEMTFAAAARIVRLIESAHPNSEITASCDLYPGRREMPEIEISGSDINSVLGTDLGAETIAGALKAAAQKVSGDDPWIVVPPSYRKDLRHKQDFAEEVARYAGYDIIPSSSRMPALKAGEGNSWALDDYLRRRFSYLGFCEAYNYDLVSENEVKNLFQEIPDLQEIRNPLSAEWRYLRNHLAYGLLKNLRHNINRRAESVFLYEIGNVYFPLEGKVREEKRIAGVCWGEFSDGAYWGGDGEKADFFFVKGALSTVFSFFGVSFSGKGEKPSFLYSPDSMTVRIRGGEAGVFGRVNAGSLSNCGIKERDVFYFEISLSAILSAIPESGPSGIGFRLKPVSPYPSVKRDLCVVVPDEVEWESMRKKASAAAGDISKIEAIDVYKGKGIEDGFKSVTMRFVFSSSEKTFTDEEINSRIEAIFTSLREGFGARLRD